MATLKPGGKKVKKVTADKLKAKKRTAKETGSGKPTETKVSAKNPRGKQGVNISQEKYDLLRQNILAYIWRHEEASFDQLLKDLEEKLAKSFEGSVSWYVTWVKMDLETKEIIEQVPGKKPQHLRLKHRLEQPED